MPEAPFPRERYSSIAHSALDICNPISRAKHDRVMELCAPAPNDRVLDVGAGKGTLLLEFVPREDPRFVELAGPHMSLYRHWDLPFVLGCAEPWFELQDQTPISEHRTLLRLRRRAAPPVA